MAEAKAEGKTLPAGALTSLPADHKALDGALVDELLSVCDLWDKAIQKDPRNKIKIDWKSIGNKNGCEMFSAQTPGTAYYFFKGVNIIEAPVKVVEEAMRQIENMKLIDPMCKNTRTIKTFDRDHHIYYAAFKMPPMISDRDFVWWSVDANLPDGTYVTAAKSLVTADCGPEYYHVRGEIRASGYVVEPVKDKPQQSRVTYVVQTSPGGWLPAWVVNIVAASQAYNPGIIKERTPVFLEQVKKQEAARKQEDEWKAKLEAERKKREADQPAATATAAAPAAAPAASAATASTAAATTTEAAPSTAASAASPSPAAGGDAASAAAATPSSPAPTAVAAPAS